MRVSDRAIELQRVRAVCAVLLFSNHALHLWVDRAEDGPALASRAYAAARAGADTTGRFLAELPGWRWAVTTLPTRRELAELRREGAIVLEDA